MVDTLWLHSVDTRIAYVKYAFQFAAFVTSIQLKCIFWSWHIIFWCI